MKLEKMTGSMMLAGLALLLTACATAPEQAGQSEAREAATYSTGSNLARRDRSGDNVKVVDKEALQQQLNAAGKNMSELK